MSSVAHGRWPHEAAGQAVTTAAILAGGLGTRLQTVSGNLPKALVPVTGRPFLCLLLDLLAQAGIRTAVLCTGYQADKIRDALESSYAGLTLIHSAEPAPLGTAGALRLALPFLPNAPVLVVNGDSLVRMDLRRMAHEHQAKAAQVTMLLSHVPNASRFGSVQTDRQGMVTGYFEKSPEPQPGWINAGVYLMNRAVIAGIPSGRAVSLEREVLPALISGGLFGLPSPSEDFLDIGTPESYAQAEAFVAQFAPRPA